MMRRLRPSLFHLALTGIVLAGLTLRLLAAQGALWLDEAWSASFARDVGTPLGVFTAINHDNNHHLNTLWLQLVGFDAAPVVQRALSVACGTASIAIAAMLGRARRAALVTAALFALSPILVAYGSEARGYAPMVLALLALIATADRWLADPSRPFPVLGVMALCVIGVLAQMTFVFAIPAVFGWITWRAAFDHGPRSAVMTLIRIATLPCLTVAATLTAILWWLPGDAGFTFGAYTPFSWSELGAGLSDVTAFTLGLPRSALIFLLPLALVAVGQTIDRARWPFYLLAIVGFPAGVALLHIGNAGIARYYLLSTVALLLLTAAIISRRRVAGTLAFVALSIAMLHADIVLIRDRRADPGRAIAMILNGDPVVTLDRPRAEAVIDSAASSHGRSIRIADCAPWLFVDRDGDEPFPARPVRCGYAYALAAQADPAGISGTHWRLYRRERRCAETKPAP
ncbi:hypothetical protein [Sphingomonas sp. RS2018]